MGAEVSLALADIHRGPHAVAAKLQARAADPNKRLQFSEDCGPLPRGSKVTPLGYAILSGDIPLLEVLLSHGADPNKRVGLPHRFDFTPLQLAAALGQADTVRLLLATGCVDANAKLQLKTGTTNPPHVPPNLGSGVDTRLIPVHLHRTRPGDTALHIAIDCGGRFSNGLVASALASHPGTDLNAPNARSRTPLYKACKRRCEEVVALLASHPRCDVGAGGPIFAAIAVEDPVLVQLLVNAGASATAPGTVSDQRHTPLRATMSRASVFFTTRAEIVRILRDAGAVVEPDMILQAQNSNWTRVLAALQAPSPSRSRGPAAATARAGAGPAEITPPGPVAAAEAAAAAAAAASAAAARDAQSWSAALRRRFRSSGSRSESANPAAPPAAPAPALPAPAPAAAAPAQPSAPLPGAAVAAARGMVAAGAPRRGGVSGLLQQHPLAFLLFFPLLLPLLLLESLAYAMAYGMPVIAFLIVCAIASAGALVLVLNLLTVPWFWSSPAASASASAASGGSSAAAAVRAAALAAEQAAAAAAKAASAAVSAAAPGAFSSAAAAAGAGTSSLSCPELALAAAAAAAPAAAPVAASTPLVLRFVLGVLGLVWSVVLVLCAFLLAHVVAGLACWAVEEFIVRMTPPGSCPVLTDVLNDRKARRQGTAQPRGWYGSGRFVPPMLLASLVLRIGYGMAFVPLNRLLILAVCVYCVVEAVAEWCERTEERQAMERTQREWLAECAADESAAAAAEGSGGAAAAGGGGDGQQTGLLGACCCCMSHKATQGFVHRDVVHVCLCVGCELELRKRGQLNTCLVCQRSASAVVKIVAT
ncbi:hypothetical protein HYH03_004607 [Edaphochlamys debaryana]|uniref:Uncharacterized protein n=1 Tax=Edaphochlamys debaryana TaxID=47281 RepID=A0A835Y9H0_9CHLO|nr:hypothetical protein HYH03_004607 [Edaphochlamys debaryana]|eukprot:KAG2497452.1 hypothetical protein HYH03_004607 [Edaphochlamys debaryana]